MLAVVGSLISFWSVWPWAQRQNDPTQAAYAGAVGSQRALVVSLGVVIAIVGVAIFRSAPRLLLVVSALAGVATLVVAIGAIHDVREVTADDSELVSEVGWALYWIAVGSIVALSASIIGVRNWRANGRA